MPGRSRSRFAALRQGIRRRLLLQAPGLEPEVGVGKAAVCAALLMAVAVFGQLARVGVGNALNSLWAEDGPILLENAFTDGFSEAVFSPYSGYLIVVPRLIGELGAAAPLSDAPAMIAIASAAVTALSGLVVWVAAAGHIRNPYLRGSLVALTVLSPVASLESVAAGSYVLWYMLFASFWVLLWTPRTTAAAVLGGVFVLATGLSTPGLWFFAPIAALRLIAARDRRDAAILTGYAIGAAAQVPVLAGNSAAATEPEWTADIWTSYLQRVLDGGLLGERLGGIGWEVFGWALLIVLLLGALCALALVAWRSSPQVRVFTLASVGTSLLMFGGSAYQRAVGAPMMWPPDMHFGHAGRYAIVPALLLASAALVAIDRWPRPLPGPRRLPWAGLVAVAVAVVAIVNSFYVGDTAIRGTPRWDQGIDAAARSCREEGLVIAPIAMSPPGYGIFVSCQSLSDASR